MDASAGHFLSSLWSRSKKKALPDQVAQPELISALGLCWGLHAAAACLRMHEAACLLGGRCMALLVQLLGPGQRSKGKAAACCAAVPR